MMIKIIEENNENSANFLENMPMGVLNVSEPPHEKTSLHMQKQRRRSASR